MLVCGSPLKPNQGMVQFQSASASKLMIMWKAIIFASIPVVIYHILLVSARRRIKKNQELVSLTKLEADLWKIFSKYIRKSAADWKGYATCFTCPTTDDWRTFDAGHFLPQALGISALKFYEKNVHPQCVNCNRLKGGNYTEYRKRLILKYGEGIIKELNDLRQSTPYTVSDYKQKINYYSKWLKSHMN